MRGMRARLPGHSGDPQQPRNHTQQQPSQHSRRLRLAAASTASCSGSACQTHGHMCAGCVCVCGRARARAQQARALGKGSWASQKHTTQAEAKNGMWSAFATGTNGRAQRLRGPKRVNGRIDYGSVFRGVAIGICMSLPMDCSRERSSQSGCLRIEAGAGAQSIQVFRIDISPSLALQ